MNSKNSINKNQLRFIGYLIPCLIFFIIAFVLSRGLNLDPRQLPSTLLNKPVPVLHLPVLDNKKQQLNNQDFIGQISLLNVWASWCESCQAEHPVLMELAKQVRIYGLNYKDEPEQALQWLQTLGNPYHKVGADRTGRVAIDLGVYGTPETFVIDKQGIIRYKQTGPLTPEIVQKQLLPLIKQLQAEK